VTTDRDGASSHPLKPLVVKTGKVVAILPDLELFAADHCPHGTLTRDATEPAWNGYLLTVACPCGVTFARWVTPQDAAVDHLRADLQAGWN